MRIRTTLKELGKKLLRPVWVRVRIRIDHRVRIHIDYRLLPIERRLDALEKGWHQHLPGLLNAMSSVAAFGYELALLRRDMQANAYEFREAIGSLRREFEMLGSDNRPSVKKLPCILAPEKIDKARATGVRLNLGCGHTPLDGYVNVDQRELPGVDIVADVGNLPFEEGSLSEIHSAHLLEHLPQERLRRLLPYWRSLLGPNGAFRAVVPDGEAMLGGIAAGNFSFESFREVLFGAQECKGDFHFNLFTPDSLSKLLIASGFTKVAVPVKGRRNGICFEFEIRGLPG